MKAIVLGAGVGFESASSDRSHPTALHEIATGRRTLDYALEAFRSCDIEEVIFVGGYRIEQIIKLYPSLHYFYNAQWKNTGPLVSLRQALPALTGEVLVCYADVLFDGSMLQRLMTCEGAAALLEDRAWLERFAGRGSLLVETAEKVCAPDGRVIYIGRTIPDGMSCTGQFAGVVRFSADAVRIVREILSELDRNPQQAFYESRSALLANITDLLQALIHRGVTITSVNVADRWAELDAPQDVAHFVFGTKAETLQRLEGRLRHASILEQVTFTMKEWRQSQEGCLRRIRERFAGNRLVVRSSALNEDSWASSHAGRYLSVIGVEADDIQSLAHSIDRVLASYGDENENHQCLVQPQLMSVLLAGVVFTRDPETAAPYYIINYDYTGTTDAVTSGGASSAKTLVMRRSFTGTPMDANLNAVLDAVQEIEKVVGYDSLDIEFAVTRSGAVYVMQVRPLVANRRLQFFSDEDMEEELRSVKEYVVAAEHTNRLLGSKTVWGVMPDWNPAEMIGRTPRPLALSLYQYLITDEVWAIQRAEYGYRDVFPAPLVVSIGGQGFVDVRASFNSFVPRELPNELAARLVDYYIRRLSECPELHDKVEFEIAFTCYTFDFDVRSRRLLKAGFSSEDVSILRQALLHLTQNAFTKEYAIRKPLADIERLKALRTSMGSERDVSHLVSLLRLTLENCRRYGTLPFAHLARSAFIATDLLRSLRQVSCISNDEYYAYLSGIETVAGRFARDLGLFQEGRMSRDDFLKEYGHLRPGTYDILSPRYDEQPDLYFGHAAACRVAEDIQTPYEFPPKRRAQIEKVLIGSGLGIDFETFDRFVRQAIQGREYAKFEFTRDLSYALKLIGQIGAELGFTADDMSYVPIEELIRIGTGSMPCSLRSELRDLIEHRRARYRVTRALKLPHLICAPEDSDCFLIEEGRPNFITTEHVTAPLVLLNSSYDGKPIDGCIVHLESADPGYDWIFGRKIVGLLTTYGGANSHMAIRAAEFGLPAAIGCGELLVSRLRDGAVIELNCRTQQIHVVH